MVKDLHIKIEGVSFRTKEVSGHPVNEMVLKVRQNEVDSDWETLITGNYKITEDCNLVRQIKNFGDKLGMRVRYSDVIELDESCFNENVFGLTISEALENNMYCLQYHILNSIDLRYRLSVCYDFESRSFYIDTDYNGYTVFGKNLLNYSCNKYNFKDLVSLFFNVKEV